MSSSDERTLRSAWGSAASKNKAPGEVRQHDNRWRQLRVMSMSRHQKLGQDQDTHLIKKTRAQLHRGHLPRNKQSSKQKRRHKAIATSIISPINIQVSTPTPTNKHRRTRAINPRPRGNQVAIKSSHKQAATQKPISAWRERQREDAPDPRVRIGTRGGNQIWIDFRGCTISKGADKLVR